MKRVLSRLATVAAAIVVVACEPAPPAARSTPTNTLTKEGSPPPAPVTVTEVLLGDAAPPPPARPPSPPVPPVPSPASPPVASAAPPAPPSATAPKLCGCALCDPVASDDACSSDADCAPSTPCHAPACVARAKAEARKPGTMCTEVMMCGTADANACGCVKGKCTLHPK